MILNDSKLTLCKCVYQVYNMHMIRRDDHIGFEWDDRKAALNIKKHGVSFEDAMDAFSDPYARVIPDAMHSDYEERFFLIGMDLRARVLTVCHCERRGGVIRMISARRSTKVEEMQYWRCRK